MDIRAFTVRYEVFGNFRRFRNAVASFGPLPENNHMDVSVYLFDTAQSSEEYFHMLERFKGPNVVRGFLVNGREVLIDRVRDDFRSWLDRSYHEFASQPLPGSWWQFIQPSFKILFRGVCQALQHVFELGGFCGDLLDGLTIDMLTDFPKLTRLNEREQTDLNGVRLDLAELRILMEEVIIRPFQDVELEVKGPREQLVANCMDHYEVPYDLKLFLNNLGDHRTISHWPYLWVLDSPFFWDNPKKYSFIRKVHCRFYRFRDIIDINQLDLFLEYMYSLVNVSWFSLVPPGPVGDILVQTLNDQNYKRAVQRAGQGRIAFDSIFLGIIIMCKNVVGHLSTHIAGGVDDMDAMERADVIFRCGCSILQTAIGYYFFSLSRQGLGQGQVRAGAESWMFYLSTKAY